LNLTLFHQITSQRDEDPAGDACPGLSVVAVLRPELLPIRGGPRRVDKCIQGQIRPSHPWECANARCVFAPSTIIQHSAAPRARFTCHLAETP
jgi:hypothetical protein